MGDIRIHDIEQDIWDMVRVYCQDRGVPPYAIPEILRIVAAHAAIAIKEEP